MTIRSDIEENDNNLNAEHIDFNNDIYDDDNEELSPDSDYMDDEEEDDDIDDEKEQVEEKRPRRVYIPNMSKLTTTDDAEKLECDYSAYVMYHRVETGYPCLSFDIIEDSLGSGDQRAQTFPMTAYLIAGTQADKDHLNSLLLLKFFNMNHVQEPDNDDDYDEEDDEDKNPDLNGTSIPHIGCINRIRVKKIGDKLIAANWSDHGTVHLWDVTEACHSCDDDVNNDTNVFSKQNLKPIYSFTGHQTEGFGLDWSSIEEGTLATGDCQKHIFIWKLSNNGWNVDQLPLNGHEGSVEDIQWSPNETNILCSCSVDRSIRVWDIRNKRESAITIPEAHQSDVNVISWNRVEKAFILSGGDDGVIKVWDLRQVRRKSSNDSNETTSKSIASFKHHCGPITSVDWHPTDGTVFAASGEDHQVTQWDLAVENDEEQEEQDNRNVEQMDEDESMIRKLPPQLLFIHQGQKEVKEIRWHPQIPGLLISTASTGFDIIRTVSV